MIEFTVAGLFAVAGLLGLLYRPPLAYFAHSLWDFAQPAAAGRDPCRCVPWCAIIDVIVGAGLLVIWRGHGLL